MASSSRTHASDEVISFSHGCSRMVSLVPGGFPASAWLSAVEPRPPTRLCSFDTAVLGRSRWSLTAFPPRDGC
eukprot:2775020-Pyramimonas_sp.AAC.1